MLAVKFAAATTLPTRSGCPASIPVSTMAIRTAALLTVCDHARGASTSEPYRSAQRPLAAGAPLERCSTHTRPVVQRAKRPVRQAVGREVQIVEDDEAAQGDRRIHCATDGDRAHPIHLRVRQRKDVRAMFDVV